MVLICFSETIKRTQVGESFRPLAGIMVLIIWILKHYSAKEINVSVPLRGLWFLSFGTTTLMTAVPMSFRPLAGIMVLIEWCLMLANEILKMFPSPCGDYGSYQ